MIFSPLMSFWKLWQNLEYTLIGHSERSEESSIFNNVRAVTAFRMTE
jgi:hypothetical protein